MSLNNRNVAGSALLTLRFSPYLPIDRLAFNELYFVRFKPIGEEDEIVAGPACARGENTVKSEELGGVANLLTSLIRQRLVGCAADSKSLKRFEVGNLQRASGLDDEAMKNRAKLGREHRLAAEVEVNFCQCAFARQCRVQHVEGARVPPRTRRVALKHITLLPDDPPYVALECDALMGVDQVEKLVIAGAAVAHFAEPYRNAPASSRSMIASTSMVRSAFMRSIARSFPSSGCRECSHNRASSAV